MRFHSIRRCWEENRIRGWAHSFFDSRIIYILVYIIREYFRSFCSRRTPVVMDWSYTRTISEEQSLQSDFRSKKNIDNVSCSLTGQVIDKKFTTSSSNFMRVSWQPNGGVNVKGVMVGEMESLKNAEFIQVHLQSCVIGSCGSQNDYFVCKVSIKYHFN